MPDNTGKKVSTNVPVVSARRALIYKALTDPGFRRQLKTEPAAALGTKKLDPKGIEEVNRILTEVTKIEQRIGGLADELLCACSVVTTGVTDRRKVIK